MGSAPTFTLFIFFSTVFRLFCVIALFRGMRFVGTRFLTTLILRSRSGGSSTENASAFFLEKEIVRGERTFRLIECFKTETERERT